MTGLTVLRVFVGPDGRGGNPLGVVLDGSAVPVARRQEVGPRSGSRRRCSSTTPRPGDARAAGVTDAATGQRAELGRRPAPAAFHFGEGHRIMYGNPAFVARYGAAAVGQPAREAMIDLPPAGFALLDRVLRDGRPLARRVDLPDGPPRLVVVPRRDPETDEVYGVTTWLPEPTA